MRRKQLMLMVFFCLLLTVFPAGHALADEGHEHQDGGFESLNLVKPLGIATLSLLLLTAIIGIAMWIRPKLRLRALAVHKILGILILLAGLSHAILIFMLH